jgi:predicted nucleotidyltransferase
LSALDRFSSAVRARFGGRVREMTLFGSHARGEANEDSDVDILVVIDDLTFEETREVIAIAYEIDLSDDWLGLAPLPLATSAAVDMRERERRLMRDIAREGIAL